MSLPEFPPLTATQVAQNARLTKAWRRHIWWQKYGVTVICTGAGGTLGHVGCVAQGIGVALFGGIGGYTSLALTLATVPIVHALLHAWRPPKSPTEHRMRRRASAFALVAGVGVAATIHGVGTHQHGTWYPPGNYSTPIFEDLNLLQRQFIRTQFSAWLDQQPPASRQEIIKQATAANISPTAYLWEKNGIPLLDNCVRLSKQSSTPQSP